MAGGKRRRKGEEEDEERLAVSGEKLEEGKMEEKRRGTGMKERREGNKQSLNGKEKAKTGMGIGVLCLCIPAEIQSPLPSVSVPKGTCGHGYPPTSGPLPSPKHTL